MKLHKPFFILFAIFLIASCQSVQQEKTTNQASSAEVTNEQPPTTKPKAAPLSQTALPAPLYGIDISKFQGSEIDLLNKQKDKLTFVICKATEGVTYTDPRFKSNWMEISKKGFIKGAYHFYRSSDNPTQQADFFINQIHDLAATDLPPIVDFEGGSVDRKASVKAIQDDLIIFLNQVAKQSGRKPMIYTNISAGNKYLNDPAFSDYALWVADYIKKEQPNLPEAWQGQQWQFWQKTSNYVIDQQKNDFDLFNGNQEDLKTFIKNSQ